MSYLIVVLVAYLLGSIPFGLVLTWAVGAGDIRQMGSGNIGATNVLRTGKKGLAFATLVLDAGKGTAAVLLAELFFPGMGHLAGLAALLGHIFPLWLGFKGGKGVATAFGVALGIAPPLALASLGIWLVVALLSRISSLSALSAVGAAPFLALFLGRADAFPLFATIAILVLAKHQANIRRLINGTEPKIGLKKEKEKENDSAST